MVYLQIKLEVLQDKKRVYDKFRCGLGMHDQGGADDVGPLLETDEGNSIFR